MNKNRNTDQLFGHMRKMPVEVPFENVEKFVIAQVALGITATVATKGIFTKAFLKFHLNSILIMTSTLTAALVSIIAWNSGADKVTAQKNHKSNFEFSSNALIPDLETEADTPRTTTTKSVSDGAAVSVTTIETDAGTKIKVIENGNQTSVYYNTTNDSNFVFAYASKDQPATAPYPAAPFHGSFKTTPPVPPVAITPMTPVACCASNYDSLSSAIAIALFKDGLITDSANFSFKLNGHSIFVDGKKQDKALWEKYKDIVEKNSSYRMGPFLIITINKNAETDLMSINDQLVPLPPMEPMEPLQEEFPLQNSTDTLRQTIENYLFKDHLISDTEHYMFKINGSYLKVNGNKLSKEQWQRYKEIIESSSMNKVNKKFSYAVLKNGDDVRINVENYID
ncbi:MAG: hypothetical protein ABIQ40_10390 [Bacteroidia bacterium]